MLTRPSKVLLHGRGRGSSAVSVDESNIEEEIAELRREIAAGGDSKQGDFLLAFVYLFICALLMK